MSDRRHRIAVGVDGTSAGTEAVLWALDEARRSGAELELIHALPAPPPGTADHDDRAVQGTVLLERAAAAARSVGVPVTCAVVDRPAGPVLVEISERVGLLVVGRRAGGMMVRDAHSRSVARHVSRYAACPVVVVPQRSLPAIGRIVVHLTGRPDDLPALTFAFDHAAATGAEIEAIHPLPLRTGCSPLVDGYDTQVQKTAEIMLAEELAGFAQSHPDVKVFRHCVPAEARDVLQWASSHADLVVLSAPRPYDASLARPSSHIGSLQHAHCPVVYAR
jgi:nucleotide-binding universal stress UspA family protein